MWGCSVLRNVSMTSAEKTSEMEREKSKARVSPGERTEPVNRGHSIAGRPLHQFLCQWLLARQRDEEQRLQPPRGADSPAGGHGGRVFLHLSSFVRRFGDT